MGETDPVKIEEFNNFSDPQTKYLVYRVWIRHLHYTHNLKGDPPPPVDIRRAVLAVLKRRVSDGSGCSDQSD